MSVQVDAVMEVRQTMLSTFHGAPSAWDETRTREQAPNVCAVSDAAAQDGSRTRYPGHCHSCGWEPRGAGHSVAATARAAWEPAAARCGRRRGGRRCQPQRRPSCKAGGAGGSWAGFSDSRSSAAAFCSRGFAAGCRCSSRQAGHPSGRQAGCRAETGPRAAAEEPGRHASRASGVKEARANAHSCSTAALREPGD